MIPTITKKYNFQERAVRRIINAEYHIAGMLFDILGDYGLGITKKDLGRYFVRNRREGRIIPEVFSGRPEKA